MSSVSDSLHKKFAVVTGSLGVHHPCSILGPAITLEQHHQNDDQSQDYHAQDTCDCGKNGHRTCGFLF